MPKLGFYLSLVLAVVIIIAAGILFIDRNATDRAAIKMERQNNAAGDGADVARDRFDDCSGGLWDFGAGKCLRSTPRYRN